MENNKLLKTLYSDFDIKSEIYEEKIDELFDNWGVIPNEFVLSAKEYVQADKMEE